MKEVLLVVVAANGLFGLLASTVSAEEFNYAGDNHSWSLSCNGSGYVLRTQYPVMSSPQLRYQ